MAGDFIDDIIAKRTARNPDFPKMVKEAMARQDRVRQTLPDEPSSKGIRTSHEPEAPRVFGARVRELAAHARELADRRKRKTPA